MISAVETRVNAYNFMLKLKRNNVPQTELLKRVQDKFGLPYHTMYGWYKYGNSPFGKRKLEYNKELFYVLGALLGDGCAYHWKKQNKYMVIVSGEKEFIDKYSDKLLVCMKRRIKGYPEKSKNVWHLRTWNIELYLLLRNTRKDLESLKNLFKTKNHEKALQFIEGYFDAEGCVKIIKEKVRKTPKICLDICNTDYSILEVIRKLFKRHFNIEARYSIQKPKLHWNGNKTSYHLRIYRKEYIQRFFDKFHTIKLKPEKVSYVENWLNNGK